MSGGSEDDLKVFFKDDVLPDSDGQSSAFLHSQSASYMNNYVASYDRTLLQTIAAVRGGSASVQQNILPGTGARSSTVGWL